MSSAAAITITSAVKNRKNQTKSGKPVTDSGAANLGSVIGAAGGGTPPTVTVTSGTTGGN